MEGVTTTTTSRRLTRREISLIQGVIDGKSNKAIAADLGLSCNSIKVYFSRIFDKLSVGNRSQLANWGRAYGAAKGLVDRRYKELHPDAESAKRPIFEGLDLVEFEVFRAMALQIVLTPQQVEEIIFILDKKRT